MQTKSKCKKNVVILSTTRPMHSCTKDDNKSKPQIFKFYDFTKGGTDIVDQMNDYFTTRAKSLRWVMIVLYYMLDTARVNAKTIWCIKNGIDHHKLKSYNFGWDLAKTLTMPHVIRRDVNGLGLMVQLKRNLFLGTAFVVPEPKPKIKKRFECTAKRKNMQFPSQTVIVQGQLSNANLVEIEYVENNHSVHARNALSKYFILL